MSLSLTDEAQKSLKDIFAGSEFSLQETVERYMEAMSRMPESVRLLLLGQVNGDLRDVCIDRAIVYFESLRSGDRARAEGSSFVRGDEVRLTRRPKRAAGE